MNGFFETLEQFLTYQGMGLAGIVHIGAGACEELPCYRKCDPEYLVLVDADEQTCIDLREEIGEVGYCRVICQAVSISQPTLKLNQFNNARLNSVLSLKELKVHYPGLKQVNTTTSPSIPLDDFLKTLDLPDCEPDEKVSILFLDNCGLGIEVFERVTERERDLFNYIVVRNLGGTGLLNQAAGKNKHELIQVSTLRLPFVDQVFKNNKKYRKLAQENLDLKLLLNERDHELEKLELSFEAVSDELKSSYSQLKEASSANAHLYEEFSDYRKAGTDLENQVRHLEREAAASGEKLLKSQARVQELSQKNTFLKSSLDKTDGELEKRQHLLEKLSSEFESISSELKSASSKNDRLKEELSQSRKYGESLEQDVAVSGEKILELEAEVKKLSERNSLLKSSLDEQEKMNQEFNLVRHMLDQEIMKVKAQLELVKDVVLREKEF